MYHIQKLIKLHTIIKDVTYDHRPAPFCSNPYQVIKPPPFETWQILWKGSWQSAAAVDIG